MKNWILIGFAAFTGWYIFTKTQLAGKTKLIFKKIGFANKKFQLVFGVQNPTGQTAKISAITGEVYLGDKLVADFSSFGEQKIAARSESELKIQASPTIGILQLITTKGWLKKGLQYTIKGTGNFDGIVVPFDYKASLI
tara:strand:- start:86 stop:502 length:417 start_codon:yes stop_codon:yes gene_type:complete